MMPPAREVIELVAVMAVSYLAAAAAAFLFEGDRARHAIALLSAAGALSGAGAAAIGLASGGTPGLDLPSALPEAALAFRLDPLSAAFLILIGLVAVPAAIYSIGYRPEHAVGPGHGASGRRGSARRPLLAMFPLFLLAMSLVVLAGSVFTFLLFWEAMSLASYLTRSARPPGGSRRRRVTPSFSWPCSASARRRGSCRCTPGSPGRTPRPPATSRPSCRVSCSSWGCTDSCGSGSISSGAGRRGGAGW